MEYPTLDEVEAASHLQICTWWRRLPGPGMGAIDEAWDVFEDVLRSEGEILDRIGARLKEFGGFTPAISKSIGWDKRNKTCSFLRNCMDYAIYWRIAIQRCKRIGVIIPWHSRS